MISNTDYVKFAEPIKDCVSTELAIMVGYILTMYVVIILNCYKQNLLFEYGNMMIQYFLTGSRGSANIANNQHHGVG